MRKLSYILSAGLLMAACATGYGAPKSLTVSLDTGDNASSTSTVTSVSGYIDEIVLEAPSGVTTGVVTVVATQPLGNTVTLASKTVSTDTLVRLRVDGTDSAGTALTNDPPGRYLSYGDSIEVKVAAADPTGLVWRVWIKYDSTK